MSPGHFPCQPLDILLSWISTDRMFSKKQIGEDRSPTIINERL